MEMTFEEVIVINIGEKDNERKYLKWNDNWYTSDFIRLNKIDSESNLIPLLNSIVEMKREMNKWR